MRKVVVACSLPVVLVTATLVWQRSSSDAPYVAGKETEGITRVLERDDAGADGSIRFADVTEASGVHFVHFPYRRTSQLPEDMGSGAAWGDYDGDGLLDLFLVNIAAPLGVPASEMLASSARDRLYRNAGDGTFRDVTAEAGVGTAHRGMGATWGDHDADGDLDLFVTSWGTNILWENLGDGRFADVTEEAGLAEEGFWTGASWSDFDLDGDLDLYVCGYVEYVPERPAAIASRASSSDFPYTLNPSSWPPHPNRLYVNDGSGIFVERAREAGVAAEGGKSLCAAWADFDGDGLPDLYVANDVSDNAMYLNRGDGTFEDVSYQALVADYRGAMGVAIGDWDGDLDVDLFITHWVAQENALYSNLLSDHADKPDDAPMMFADDADRFGLGQIALDLIGWGTAFADFDRDGWLDLFVVNGSTFQDRSDPTRLVPMHPHLYRNRGRSEGFFEIGEHAGIRADPPGVGRGAAFGDYDRDGDLDVVVSRHGGRARLLRNDSDAGHWVGLRLGASKGHPSGLGTRVIAYAGGRAHLREAGAGPSYLSHNDPDVLIGLGDAARIDSLEVRWPRAERDLWRDLAVDRFWLVEQGAAPRPDPLRPAPPASTGARVLSRDDVRRFWQLKDDADARFGAGAWAEAAALYSEMLDLDPEHEDALYTRGNCLMELGRFDEAKRSWEALLRVNPASSRAWVQIGVVHATPSAGELFDPMTAAEAFGRAHEINPEESGPLTLRGEALLAAGAVDEAGRVLADAIGMNDQAPSALLLAGYVAWTRGETTAATELLSRAARSMLVAAPPEGVLGEGDARSDALGALQRQATRRGLFAGCLDELGPDGDAVDPERAFARVEARLRELRSRIRQP